MKPIVIVAAKRTPQGRLMGAFSKRSAVDLALMAGRGAMGETIAPDQIDAVIMGNVLSAGTGMNIGRQIGVKLGLPVDRTGLTVNMMCASGMCSLFMAAQSIATGEHTVVLCGGTESMTSAPYLLPKARMGYRFGDGAVVDSILNDGLTDPFSGLHMGLTAERLAEEFGIDRAAQDEFAARSQQRCGAAMDAGRLDDELVPTAELQVDEHPRPDTTSEKLSELKPAFKADGTVTAGNASGVNDGASILIVCDEGTAQAKGWTPLARLTGFTTIGCDPARMGLGPVHATRKLCKQHDLDLATFDTVELNEAFAAQALACIQELGLDEACVNPDGGAIALGHPVGATGARLVAHLAHRIARGETTRGLATLCVGGGMGAAVALEKAC
ncbi:MAG: acetyl-CoA C-acyltransferase [Lentisphaerae bacterium]|nr:acetyl-CoA C-acyltransferase [Lentisphaerota bacterium]